MLLDMDERDDPTAFDDDKPITITKGELRALLTMCDDFIYDSGSYKRQAIRRRLEKRVDDE